MTKADMDAANAEYAAAHSELDAAEAQQVAGLGDKIKQGAAAFGRALLGNGTEKDATDDGIAYKLYMQERDESSGPPMSRDEFIKSRRATPKG